MENKEIDFIAKHYRPGRFNVNQGWKRLGIRQFSFWRKYRAVASIAAVVVLTTSATFIYKSVNTPEAPAPQPQRENAAPSLMTVRTIDFEAAPLNVVALKINEVYGVKVTNLPEDPEYYKLSLHYEGTAADLVATINEILGTELKVEAK